MEFQMPHLKGLQQNQMLATFPIDVQERLYPHMDLIELPSGKVLYESGDTLRYVYFPTDSVVSLLHVTECGACAEISVVGNEGLIGISLFMGGGSTNSKALVQSAGYAYRLLGQRLKDEFNRHGALLHTVLRYTQALITQMAQTAACNRHHSIEQRLCRWLLVTLDRREGNELVMTQELIATMLGVRREGVTEAAGRLQRMGVIEYHRGRIQVINRTQLEALSCECYAAVRKESERLLPWINTINS
jgi:CRP-like cAMP-binding protein